MENVTRYTDEELLAMLHGLESDLVERKESLSGDVPRRAREAICAFANDLPNHRKAGVLIIGAKDDGTPSGLEITDKILLTLSDMNTDIVPFPAMTVECRVLDGTAFAVVTVMPSDSPPVKYDGRICIRRGPRRAVANAQEERLLSEKRQNIQIPFDLHPVYGARITDLSRVFFEEEYLPHAFAREILEANHRTYEERLASCKFIVSPEDTTPTFLGIMTIGKNPRSFIPSSYIQFLRIAGLNEMAPIVDSEEIDGRIGAMYSRAEDKFRAHNQRAVNVFSGPSALITWDYPETAFRQLMVNAILHRNYDGSNASIAFYWYDDRIEIISPGGPYGDVTVENFGKPGLRSYRNRNLADVITNLDLMQRYGFGIPLARQTMQENGNPPIEFDVDNSFVRVVLGKR